MPIQQGRRSDAPERATPELMTRPKLSLVIPCFNESETIPELNRRLTQFLSALPEVGDAWETVFIDDGSRDGSGAMLSELAKVEPRFKVVLFARNFGHQIAITARSEEHTSELQSPCN